MKTVVTVTHLRGVTLRQVLSSAEMPVLRTGSAWYTTFFHLHGKKARMGFHSGPPTRLYSSSHGC